MVQKKWKIFRVSIIERGVKPMISKGDICFVRHYNANPRKNGRPAVILSGEEANRDSDSVIVAFLSNNPKAVLEPSGVPIKSMGDHSFAITNKLSAISKNRLSKCIGRASPEELVRLESSLCKVLEL